MKTIAIHLLVVLLLASGSSAFARVMRKTYYGSFGDRPCTVQMTWQNWEGLGAIDGVIRVSDGTTIPFSGSNSRSGVLEFNAKGNSYRLVRRDVGRQTSWVSARLSFSEAAPAPTTPTPTPTPSPSPAAEGPAPGSENVAPQMVDESYTGSWRGREFIARVRWAPGDEPGIVRRGRGTLIMAGGQQFSIEGWQPSADSAEFTIKPDDTGETYKTTKGDRDGNPSWESSSLILRETK
jgi:hypothetical protein